MPRVSGTRREQRSPELAAWHAIQKRGRVCKRWGTFRNFHADVGEQPTWRHLLIRDDPSGAFEPGNARWRVARWFRRRSETAQKR